MSSEEVAPVDGRLCTLRVFGVSRDFVDRPKDSAWSTSAQVGPAAGDTMRVSIGDIPSHVVEGVRSYQAHQLFMLNSMFGNHYAGKSPDEIQKIVRQIEDGPEGDRVEAKMRGRVPTWITVELCRPVQLRAASTRYLWARQSDLTVQMLDGFLEEAEPFLDSFMPKLIAAMGSQLEPDMLLVGRRRVFVVAPGKAAFGIPDFDGSASMRVSGSGWDELPFADVEAAVESAVGSAEYTKLVGTASRWLMAALQSESDALRRFLFAFFGLEVLANKVGKKVESSVVRDLSDDLGLPVEHLVWPAPADADSPWRNLTFRFAMMAVKVARDTAQEDIEQFRRLAKHRNDLAHGSASSEDIENVPAGEVMRLLERYLLYVARADLTG